MDKTYAEKHTCNLVFKNKRVNSRVIDEHFIQNRKLSFVAMKIKEIMVESKDELFVDIPKTQYRRVKIRMQKHFVGNYK